jgi:hypothetical protein
MPGHPFPARGTQLICQTLERPYVQYSNVLLTLVARMFAASWGGPGDQNDREFKFTAGHGFIRASARIKSGRNAGWWMRATV